MGMPIRIDPRDGSIVLGDDVRLEPFQKKRAIEPLVANLVDTTQDHGNGYEWLHLRDLSFGGHPAWLALCFQGGRLEQVSWSVRLPTDTMEGGWSTREAMDEEIAFVRSELGKDGLSVGEGDTTFPWGVVWSHYDPRGDLASHGLRYDRA